MELKWLEDFLRLARTGSFSRSAVERHVTQPAFGRRIRALEGWLGVALVDRSTYPTALPPEGRLFLETAEEPVRRLHASRDALRDRIRPPPRTVSVAARHTLALPGCPRWFRDVEARTGPLGSRLLPDDFHACVQALAEGGYDLLLTYHHPLVPIPLDPAAFPHLAIGRDSLVPVHRPGPAADRPGLGYPRDSFLGRVAALAGDGAAAAHVNENAMAEALKFMVLEGHGRAWLPESLVARELADGSLVAAGPGTALEIRLYRRAGRGGAVEAVWAAAAALAAEA